MTDPDLVRRILAAALIAALGLFPAAALARPADPAQRAFERGGELFRARDFLGAIEAFEEAYRLKPHFMVQCNIARCHEWAGNVVKASEHYNRCLKEGASKTPQGAKVLQALAQVEAKITWIEIRSPGAGGVIHVDGQPSGRAPGRVAVNPGTRVVEVRREGATPASTTIKTRGGERLGATLVPQDIKTTVTIVAPPTTEPRGNKLRPHWFWIAAGATVAAAGATAAAGVLTLKARDDYQQTPTQLRYDRAVNRRLVTNILIGVTAAAAGTTAALVFFTDFKRERQSGGEEETAMVVGVRGSFR